MTRITAIAIALAFVLSTARGQETSYWRHLRSNIPTYMLWGTAGAFNGAADTMRDKYSVSVFPQSGSSREFWDPRVSWTRKYKNWPEDPRARYPGAKTWLVWTTDGWHMAKAGQLLSLKISVLTYTRPPAKIVAVPPLYPETDPRQEKRIRWLWYLGDFAIMSLFYSAGWQISSWSLTKNR